MVFFYSCGFLAFMISWLMWFLSWCNFFSYVVPWPSGSWLGIVPWPAWSFDWLVLWLVKLPDMWDFLPGLVHVLITELLWLVYEMCNMYIHTYFSLWHGFPLTFYLAGGMSWLAEFCSWLNSVVGEIMWLLVIVRYHDDGSKKLNTCIWFFLHMVYL
jgi:hypothetical protein